MCVCCFSGVVVEGCCVCLLLQQLGFFFFETAKDAQHFICSTKFRYFFVTISSATVLCCVCVCLITFSRRLVSFFNSIEIYLE